MPELTTLSILLDDLGSQQILWNGLTVSSIVDTVATAVDRAAVDVRATAVWSTVPCHLSIASLRIASLSVANLSIASLGVAVLVDNRLS